MGRKRIIQVVIIIIGLILIIKLLGDIFRLLKAGEQVRLAGEKVYQLEKEKKELQGKHQYYQSEEFIEEEARNKLNMARPGETIVILPSNLGELVGKSRPSPSGNIPNWQKWLKLFW